MNTIYSIWTNKYDSSRVKAFKSALTFRTNEVWQWTDEPDGCDLWVVDATQTLSPEIERLYQEMSHKPNVAVIGLRSKTANIPSKWQLFATPVSVPVIFRWLDSNFYQSTRRLKSKNIRPSDIEPWKQHEFKLISWPNISRYGSKVSIAVTCSNLLNAYHDFETALKWGVSAEILNEILKDAYQTSLLKIRSNDDSKHDQIDHSHNNKSDKNVSLIQKLMSRFR